MSKTQRLKFIHDVLIYSSSVGAHHAYVLADTYCLRQSFNRLAYFSNTVNTYFKKLKLLTTYGSFALPLQIEKNAMILHTNNTIPKIPAAIGTINVQIRSSVIIPVSTSSTVNFSACLTWNDRYGESLLASSA